MYVTENNLRDQSCAESSASHNEGNRPSVAAGIVDLHDPCSVREVDESKYGNDNCIQSLVNVECSKRPTR